MVPKEWIRPITSWKENCGAKHSLQPAERSGTLFLATLVEWSFGPTVHTKKISVALIDMKAGTHTHTRLSQDEL